MFFSNNQSHINLQTRQITEVVPRKLHLIPESTWKLGRSWNETISCFHKDFFELIRRLLASFFARSRGKKHSVILRTQLTVRVHACIGECCVTCLYVCLRWAPPSKHTSQADLRIHCTPRLDGCPGFYMWHMLGSDLRPPTQKQVWLVCEFFYIQWSIKVMSVIALNRNCGSFYTVQRG